MSLRGCLLHGVFDVEECIPADDSSTWFGSVKRFLCPVCHGVTKEVKPCN